LPNKITTDIQILQIRTLIAMATQFLGHHPEIKKEWCSLFDLINSGSCLMVAVSLLLSVLNCQTPKVN
jgi:hypothetical protein